MLVGARSFSLFRVFGVVGIVLGIAVHQVGAVRAGLDPMSALGAGSAALLSFPVYAIIRRAVTGSETLVLFEHVWAALGAVAVYAWAAGLPLLSLLDATAPAIAIALSAGRLGCLSSGCCHGGPSRTGMRYGPSIRLSPRLRAQRLFPVQLIESAALAVIAVVGLLLVGRAPGTSLVWVLLIYGVVRVANEQLRGDVRPRIFTVPVAVGSALGQIAAALVVAQVWLGPDSSSVRNVVPAAFTVAALVTLAATTARPLDPVVEHAHLDEIWRVAHELDNGTAAPVVAITSQQCTIAASREGPRLHVSLSHPDRSLLRAGHCLDLGAFERNGVVHVELDAQQLHPRQRHVGPEHVRPTGSVPTETVAFPQHVSDIVSEGPVPVDVPQPGSDTDQRSAAPAYFSAG